MTPPHDALAGLISPALQKEAANLAQDGFTRVFRLLTEGDESAAELGLSVIETRARGWAFDGQEGDAALMRLALLVSGLDQWGIALTQALSLQALPGLTALLGNLRMPLDAQAGARFEQLFADVEAREENAIDFKMELRRGIHLALWHAIAASDDEAERTQLIQRLGSQMLSMTQNMPTWGGHLLADSIAHIQLRLLSATQADAVAEAATSELFGALQQALGQAQGRTIFGQAAQLVLAYQSAQRTAAANSEA